MRSNPVWNYSINVTVCLFTAKVLLDRFVFFLEHSFCLRERFDCFKLVRNLKVPRCAKVYRQGVEHGLCGCEPQILTPRASGIFKIEICSQIKIEAFPLVLFVFCMLFSSIGFSKFSLLACAKVGSTGEVRGPVVSEQLTRSFNRL